MSQLMRNATLGYALFAVVTAMEMRPGMNRWEDFAMSFAASAISAVRGRLRRAS